MGKNRLVYFCILVLFSCFLFILHCYASRHQNGRWFVHYLLSSFSYYAISAVWWETVSIERGTPKSCLVLHSPSHTIIHILTSCWMNTIFPICAYRFILGSLVYNSITGKEHFEGTVIYLLRLSFCFHIILVWVKKNLRFAI